MYVYIKHIVRFCINSAKGVIVMERKMNIYPLKFVKFALKIEIVVIKHCVMTLRPHGL